MSDSAVNKEKQVKYFQYCLKILPQPYTSTDTNRMTLVFFAVSGLDVLGALDLIKNRQQIIEWIYSLQIVSSNGLDCPPHPLSIVTKLRVVSCRVVSCRVVSCRVFWAPIWLTWMMMKWPGFSGFKGGAGAFLIVSFCLCRS